MQRQVVGKRTEEYVRVEQPKYNWFTDSITATVGFKNTIESSFVSCITAYGFNKCGLVDLSCGDAVPIGFFTKMVSNQSIGYLERFYPDFMRNHPLLQAFIPVGAAVLTNIPVWIACAMIGEPVGKLIIDSAIVLSVPVAASVVERLPDKCWALFFNQSNHQRAQEEKIDHRQIFNHGIASLRG